MTEKNLKEQWLHLPFEITLLLKNNLSIFFIALNYMNNFTAPILDKL